jgi:hypothetical protein
MATVAPILGPHPHAGVVYVDGWHALVARSGDSRHVTDLVRSWESEEAFIQRVAVAANDCDCLVILGTDRACLDLEHEWETLYQRPHLIDVEAAAEPRPVDLLDRLRFLDGLAAG